MKLFVPSLVACLFSILVNSTAFGQVPANHSGSKKLEKASKKKPTIYTMTPTSGGLGGKTVVTISGGNFSQKSLPVVTFNGTSGSVTLISKTKISVITPAASAATPVTVVVNIGGKPDTLKVKYNYKLPEITSISPSTSGLSGGDTIKIKGKYFTGASYVLFGTPGASPVLNSVTDTSLLVVTPANTAGKDSVKVQVQGIYSLGSSSAVITYNDPLADLTYEAALKNLTGLDKKYKVFVLGYSTGARKILTVDPSTKKGTFTAVSSTSQPDSGYVQSYEMGTEITSIELSNSNPIYGARIYFFVADTTVSYKDSSNCTQNGNLGFYYYNKGASVLQVQNPPQTAYPPFSYIEPTFKSEQGLFIDVSSVDGFFFPMSISALGTTGEELGRIGQPAGMTSDAILAAYKPFIDSLAISEKRAKPFLDLYKSAGDGLDVIYNPGLYLQSACSALDTVFDSALNSLFNDTMSIWQNGANATQTNECFTVTPASAIQFPGTTNKHGALRFKNPAGTTYYVFNPVGFSVVSFNKYNSATKKSKQSPIQGSIKKNVLKFVDPLPISSGLVKGMYVQGGAGATEGQTIIDTLYVSHQHIDSVGLTTSADYSSTATYKFAKAPIHYYNSSGLTAFAGLGLFADGTFRFADTTDQVLVNGFENQLSTALNRGVALLDYSTATGIQDTLKPQSKGMPGYTTYNWGIETYWYPVGQPQNYFSLFMHTAKAKVQGATKPIHIFTLPPDSTKSSRGTFMSMAYGFAYDENPIYSVPGPQVPSEFSGEFPTGTVSLSIELGPWHNATNK